MFTKTRLKYASKCGKVEHFAGRLVGLLVAINLIYDYVKEGEYLFNLLIFVVWIIYILSHTLEKFIYGKHGFR